MSPPERDVDGPTPAVSVVVATRNRADRLSALLDALAGQTIPGESFEVIAVDDGSDDRTPRLLDHAPATQPFALRALDGPGAGPAAARNAGWRAARARLVAFTDDDCEPDPGWLAAGLAAAADRPNAIVQGRTRPIPGEADEHRGAPVRTKSIDGPGPWFQTCNMFYPRRLLEQLGGFDERFTRPFGEDVDLGWRALGHGAEARFEPDALVHHAVEPLSRAELLRSALRDPDEALVFRRHPGLRRRVRRLGLFKSDHHALLAVAGLALLGGRGRGVSAAFAMPYAVLLLARCRGMDARLRWAPWLIAHDALEIAQALRGAARHRAPIL